MVRSIFDITIDFEKSQGSYIFDKKSNEYFLDMFSMWSSLPLGYNHEIFDEGFVQRINNISHIKMCNNIFHSDDLESFEKTLLQISIHPNVHFCSTGALAVESALKCGYEFCKNPDAIVVGAKNSFHGINSWGFVTDRDVLAVQNRVKHFPKNNWRNIELEKLPKFLTENSDIVSSCIIEPIQCTAGDIYPDINQLIEVQDICKKNNICFVVDEIQTGLGVTGDYWYSNQVDLKPDILVFGKKSQISGIMVNEKYAEALKSPYLKLEVTFDGDLIDACRGEYVIKAIEKYSLLLKVRENSEIIEKELSQLFLNYRSAGYLIAFDFISQDERDNFVSKAYENKLLVNPTAEKSVRLRPNLALSNNEIDDLLQRIKKSRK